MVPIPDKPLEERWRLTVHYIWWFIKDQWFLLVMAILIVIASQVQVSLDKQTLKQTIVSYASISTIFLITGLTLKTRALINNYSRWQVHLFVQVQSLLLTSAIVYSVVSAAASNHSFMDPGLLIGMIFLGSVPTTLASNVVMTGQAHGNSAMTVVQTTIGNILGPILSPLLIKMYTASGKWYTKYLDDTSGGGLGDAYRRVFMQLGLSVYVPMAIGQVVQNLFPQATNKIFIDWKLKKAGSFALLIIIWQTFDQAFAVQAFQSVKPSNIVFIVFMNVVFFLTWLLICFVTSTLWLPKFDVISICYTVPAKSAAMGVPLANVMYAGLSLLTESKMQIPLILFQGLQITFSSLLTIAFRKWIRSDEERQAAEQKRRGAEAEQASVP